MSSVKREVTAVRSDTEAIRADTANISAIRQDTAHIESLVQQIGLLRLHLERTSIQDDRNLPLRRFLDQSTSYAESLADPFGDETDAFQDIPAQVVASNEPGPGRSPAEWSVAEASSEIAHLISSPDLQHSELHPGAMSGDFPRGAIDDLVHDAAESERRRLVTTLPPRTTDSRPLDWAVESNEPGILQSSSSQSSGASPASSSLTDGAANVSVPIELRTVLTGKLRHDEQAIKSAASRRSLLTEKQKNELDERLAGELTGSIPSMTNYYYLGEDEPKEDAPDYLVAALLDLGADVNGMTKTRGCFLQAEMSKTSPSSKVLRLLLARGATLDQFTARQLLLCAIFLSSTGEEIAESFAEVALNNGVWPNMRIEQADIDETLHFHARLWTPLGWSLVAYAACSAALEVLRLLLARGAVFDQADARRTLFVATRLEDVRGLNLAELALANEAAPDSRIEQSDVDAWPPYDVTAFQVLKNRGHNDKWIPTHYFESRYIEVVANSSGETRPTLIPTRYFESRHIGWTAVQYAVECKYRFECGNWDRDTLTDDWRPDLSCSPKFPTEGWTFIRKFVQLLTDHGASYEAGVLTFAVKEAAWSQLDWVLAWKRNAYATSEVGPRVFTTACVQLISDNHPRAERVAILQSLIASGAVLQYPSVLQRWETAQAVEVLRFYETERKKRLQVNRRVPGTYTEAQCRVVPELNKRINKLLKEADDLQLRKEEEDRLQLRR
jgi:hypothetical protein